MAEAHEAVAFQFTVGAEGIYFKFTPDVHLYFLLMK